jgi:hypothetical protein
MAPEQDARARAFYDHESDEQAPRRRRAAADWGVNEDIFDRMPSRRFKRADRRAEHRDEPEARRFERRVSGPSEPRLADEWAAEAPRGDDEWDEIRSRRNDWADEHERRQVAPRRDDWPAAEPRRTGERDDAAPRSAARDDHAAPRSAGDEYAEAASRFAAEYDDAPASRFAAEYDDTPSATRAPTSERRHARRPAESWTDDIPAVEPDDGKRPVDSWLEPDPGKELALAPGESRTVVLETPEPEPAVEDAPGRRTVTITGHPDRMPVPRTQRPPKSAVERIGASPDRIVGYAVLLGFVLVLIAVLTTGQ